MFNAAVLAGGMHFCVLYVEYLDSKVVRFLSTIHAHPKVGDGLMRNKWDKDSKRYTSVFQPAMKKDYDKHMGSVDLVDMLESQVRIKYKFRRPHLVNYFWHFETAVIIAHQFNALLYPEEYKSPTNRTLRTMRDDVVQLAKCLLLESGEDASGLDVPPLDKGLAHNHPPVYHEKRGACALKEECQQKVRDNAGELKRGREGCAGCGVHLCGAQCWVKWHKKVIRLT
jgi:hypothetical protein